MPPIKKIEPKEAAASGCILRLGKSNNVVIWNEELKSTVGALYGATANFLQTNTRHMQPAVIEADYVPDVEEGAAPVPAAIINKLREGAFEGRRRAVALQKADEQKIWSIMWGKMSPASQCKVEECDGYESALLSRDCVLLWDFIRRTHLTHIYGDGDPMVQVNIQEQETRYAELRQGEKEFISSFKVRFDNQVKNNTGAGVAAITDSKRALDFLCKLDPRRYRSMLAKMRNNALSMEENAYPQTLSAAYRIASGWINEDDRGSSNSESHSAFVSENSKHSTPSKQKASTITSNDSDERTRVESKLKRTSKITCFVCGEKGHYASRCALRKGVPDSAMITSEQITEEDEENDYDEAAYVTSQEVAMFTSEDVLLDSQASVSVFRNKDLLSDVTTASKHITLNGVQSGASGIRITEEGEFRTLGKVYFSSKTAANILSYAVMIDNGNKISYSQSSDTFTLIPKEGGEHLVFGRGKLPGSNGRFYCCRMTNQLDRIFVETVDDNLHSYNKREIAGAARARDLLCKMGYPSVNEAIATVQNGSNFDVTSLDFQIADAIWGPDLGSLKGKTTKKATRQADITVGKSIVQTEQILAVDIMFVDGVPSLIGVSTPLDLTLAVSLTSFETSKASRAAAVIKKGLVEMVSTLRSRNFLVKTIMTDGEGSIGAVSSELKMLGIEVDISGAGGHVSRVERRIRTIKERVRAHISHKLPYCLSTLGIAMLVLFCASRINFQASRSRVDGPSPRELFTGRRADAKLDFRAGYGEYAQCTVPNTDNSMSARTDDCIVMLPTGNRTGTVKMMSLTTGRIVSRDQFRLLPMPDSAIARMNDLARREGRNTTVTPTLAQTQPSGHKSVSFTEAAPGETEDPIVRLNDESGGETEGVTRHIDTGSEDMADDAEREVGVPTELVTADRHVEYDVSDSTEEPVEVEQAPRRTMLDMFRNGTDDHGDYVMNITVKNALKTRGAEAEKVIMKELSQMMSKRVWEPIHVSSLSGTDRSRIIRSQMFLKEKFLPTGEFEKLKARLVAGGDQQDKNLYEDLSSPTVSTSAVLTVLGIAAHEKRSITVVDITGAYLNADIGKEVTVHMRLDQLISSMMIRLSPEYGKYTDHRGSIVVRLEKALYGCVESAALWHEHLSGTLVELGYKKNKHEWCIFNRTSSSGVQCTIALHVDDLLVTSADGEMIELLCTGLKSKYGEISRNNGPVVNYLGMTFDMRHPGEARVSMKGYVDDLLEGSEIVGVARTPATDGLFDIRDVPAVSEDRRAKFHSLVAKVLYLAKRTKPECLTAISFLATRVTKCTGDDEEKLQRLVRYIRHSRSRGIVLSPGKMGIVIRMFVDAAYGVHQDRTSHTGSCVVVGDRGAVHCKSAKQSSMSKSSTEAELIALSDSANQALYLRWFLIDQGYAMRPVTLYQDNTSTMALVARGKPGAERTRHIDIRYFWLADRVKNKEATIEHMVTTEMYANVLTKPLQGAQFIYERQCLTGWVDIEVAK